MLSYPTQNLHRIPVLLVIYLKATLKGFAPKMSATAPNHGFPFENQVSATVFAASAAPTLKPPALTSQMDLEHFNLV